MGFMDKFTDIFKERSEDDFDDFYEDNSSDFEMPYAKDQQVHTQCEGPEGGKNRAYSSFAYCF